MRALTTNERGNISVKYVRGQKSTATHPPPSVGGVLTVCVWVKLDVHMHIKRYIYAEEEREGTITKNRIFLLSPWLS